MSIKLGTLTLDVFARIGKFVQPLKEAERQAKNSAKTIGGSLGGIGDIASRAAPMVASLAGTVTGLVASYVTLDNVINAQRTYDKQIAGLETATKSAEGAKEAYAALTKFATETPYGMEQAVEGFTKLVNLGLTPSERALRSYGNTASAMGKDLMQFIEAVADASTGEFERLKEFGIKASKEGNQVAFTFQGTTTKIKNNASDIEEYLTKIGENEFDGAMAKRMDSLDGSFANLEDSWTSLYLSISQAGVGDLVREGVDTASDGIQGLTNLIESGAIQAGLGGIARSFTLLGDDADDEMKGIAEAFGFTSEYMVKKWEATISELNAIGNAWTMMRSWVQKATVSVAAGWDIISDPFNKESSNATKQKVWQDSMAAIDADLKSRKDSVLKGFEEAEKKYQAYMAKQKANQKDTADALAKYKIAAKNAGDTASDSTEKANKALEKQKKLIEGLGSGFVSNANLKGLNLKGAESIAGGQVRGYTAEFAQLADSALGSSINRFTAFNDSYHKGTNSRHATGNAFDFTLKDAKQAEQAVKILENVAKRYGYQVKVLDEYSKPSARSTGGHLHVSVLGKNAKETWNDIQDEVALIGKGNEEAIRLQTELDEKRLDIRQKYFTEAERTEYENSEAIKAIKLAYAGDDEATQIFLNKQQEAYQKDIDAFRIAQQQKYQDAVEEAARATSNWNRSYADMTGGGEIYNLQQQRNSRYDESFAVLDSQSSVLDMQEKDPNADLVLIAEQREALWQEHTQRMLMIDQAYSKDKALLGLQTANETLSGMTDLTGSLLGEQSAAYKAMFAMSKAFAIAQALMNAPQTFSNVYTSVSAIPLIGPYIAPVMAGAAVALQVAQATQIKSVNLTGMAHDGIDNVPKEGTWLLDGGERVLNPQQNKDLTKYLSDNQRGGGLNVTVNTLPGTTAVVGRDANGGVTIDIVKQEVLNAFTRLGTEANSYESGMVQRGFAVERNRG